MPCRLLDHCPQISAAVLRSAWDALFSWRAALGEGDLLDVFNTLEGEWYLGKILHLETAESVSSEQAGDGAKEGEKESGELKEEGEKEIDKRNGSDGGGGGDLVQIHYQGWPSK